MRSDQPVLAVESAHKWYAATKLARLIAAVPRTPTAPPPGSLVALRDVSIQLSAGASLGIIGDNGAGKSTLLKLIAGTSEPSLGTVEVRGSVTSMIELGIGFHPELDGWDNLEFTASLFGLDAARGSTTAEQIVGFAEMGGDMHRPIRQWSTGMVARLGFALATHTDSDVIVIDEVFAVGDVEFQRRGLERMADLQRSGVTTVLVSHNLPAVASLCDRVIRLHEGAVVEDGSPAEVLPAYWSSRGAHREQDGTPIVEIVEFHVTPGAVTEREPIDVVATVAVSDAAPAMRAMLSVRLGDAALTVISPENQFDPVDYLKLAEESFDLGGIRSGRTFDLSAQIQSLPLPAGDYSIRLILEDVRTGVEFASAEQAIDRVGERQDRMTIPLDVRWSSEERGSA